ncbi:MULTISPECIES: hypothetical protein [unclassified Roseobacter]|uniref:hypothetical protein n=1 Tax=unclassified Roseobacter TaxID=196798 RepID=UPI0030EB54FE
MKHLLTAALIATAFASPVSAREVVLNCELIRPDGDEGDTILLRVNTETLSATLIGENFDTPYLTLVYNDEYVIWAYGVDLRQFGISASMLHLDRQSLTLVLSHASEQSFRWAETGDLTAYKSVYQCNYGI